jgi:hypothetical protein
MVHRLRHAGLVLTLGVAAAGVGAAVTVASAATVAPTVLGSVTCTDHFPPEPVRNEVTGQTTQSPSKWSWGASFDPRPAAGTPVEVTASGASGARTGGAFVNDDGKVLVDLPASSYGRHALDEVKVGGEVVTLREPVVHTIDERESTCDLAGLPTAAAATTTTTAGTATTSSSTTTTTTVRTGGVDVASGADDGDGGSDFPWQLLIAGGAALALAGGVLFAVSKNPCDELLAGWRKAVADCEEARRRAAEADAEVERAQERTKAAEEALHDLREEWPPLGWGDGDGSWMELSGVPGSRITSRDLWLSKQYAKAAWDSYKAAPGPDAAQHLMEEWRRADTPELREEQRKKDEEYRGREREAQRQVEEAKAAAGRARDAANRARAEADRICAGVAAARDEYAKKCPAAGPAGGVATGGGTAGGGGATDGGGSGGTVTGPGGGVGGGPKVATPPQDGAPCQTGDTRPATVLATFGPRKVFADVSIIVTPDRMHGAQDGQELAITLSALGADLEFLGNLLDIHGVAGALGEGKVAIAKEAGIAYSGIPDSPTDAVVKVLELTAKLGAIVAGKADEWMGNIDVFTVRIVRFTKSVHAEWREQWVCENGVWRCKRTLFSEVGPLERGQVTQWENVLKAELPERVDRQGRAIASQLQAVKAEIEAFKQRYTAGDCGC